MRHLADTSKVPRWYHRGVSWLPQSHLGDTFEVPRGYLKGHPWITFGQICNSRKGVWITQGRYPGHSASALLPLIGTLPQLPNAIPMRDFQLPTAIPPPLLARSRCGISCAEPDAGLPTVIPMRDSQFSSLPFVISFASFTPNAKVCLRLPALHHFCAPTERSMPRYQHYRQLLAWQRR